MTISVVLVQFGLPEMTQVALDSIRASDIPIDEIILVDNGSSEGEIAWAEGQVGLEVIRLPENIGYVRGTNVGWEKAKSDYILLCNNDISLSRQCLRRLVTAIESDPTVGWLSACYQDGAWQNSRVEFPVETKIDLNSSQGRNRGSMDAFSESLGDAPSVIYQALTEATVMLVRRSISDRVGLYWDKLWNHHSHDYGLRLRQAGYHMAVCRNAVFWHSESHPTIVKIYGREIVSELAEESTRLMNERWGKDWQ